MERYSLREKQPSRLTVWLAGGYLALLAGFGVFDSRHGEREASLYRWASEKADQEGNGDGFTSDRELREFCRKRGLPYYSPADQRTSESRNAFLDRVEKESAAEGK